MKEESAPNHPAFSIPSVWDWFLPVLESDRTVRASLDSVMTDLEVRTEFVRILRDRLTDPDEPETDTLTSLMKDVRSLHLSLESRLGVLSPDRPAVWFRPAGIHSTGPFTRQIAREPMFFQHNGEDVESVQSELASLWKSSSEPTQRWCDPPTIWGRILGLNHRYESICRMGGTYCSGLRLDKLPEAIPDRLNSPICRGFLQNVRTKAMETRAALDSLQAEMLAASEKLWKVLRQQSDDKSGSRMHRHYETAQNAKNEFRERRQAATRPRLVISQPVMNALATMGLRELPDMPALKKRYLELARELHPDQNPGKDDEFKKLAAAYKFLSARLKPIIRP